MWVTYVTFYRGNKLPPFYIGYTKESKILKGYRGSVKSQKYRETWYNEIKENPSLFATKILTKHTHREDAIGRESFMQKHFSVHKNDLYVNQAISNEKFATRLGRKLSEETKRKIGKANSISLKGKRLTEEEKQKRRGKWRHTEEWKVQNSIRHKGNKYNLGRKLSEETKKRISSASKGRKHTEETKYKIGLPKKGKPRSDVCKKKLSISLLGNSCRSKQYTIKYPNGKEETIKGLKKFCKSVNWPYGYVSKLVKQQKTYKKHTIRLLE